MNEEREHPCRLCAVRALQGENGGLVTGLTFAPRAALEEMRWGHRDEPGSVLAAAVQAIGLDFAFVPAAEEWAEASVERLVDAGAAPLWVVEGPFANAVATHGWTEALRLSVADPHALAGALDDGTESAVSETLRGISAGVAGVVVADDLAGAQGPLVAPDFVHEELLPRIGRVVAETDRVELPSVFHSDGDIRALLPGIARVGFSAVHVGGVGEDGFVRLLRDARQHDLRVVGGIEGAALRESLPAAIRAGTQAALFAAPGDLLIADDGSITTSQDLAAFVSAIEAAKGGGSA